jgi:transposase
MSSSIIYLGFDLHKDSITSAVLPAVAPAPTVVDRLSGELPKLKRHWAQVAQEGTLRICYEASGAGFALQRTVQAWGYHCEVIAPPLIPTKPGQQRNHDRYEAVQLARLYRAGELTVVRVPSESEERIRDLVRCRETLQRELLKSRHYLLKSLARRGLLINHVRGAVKATGYRLPASSAVSFARMADPAIPPELQPALSSLLLTVATVTDQIRTVDHQLESLARTRYPETLRLRQVGGVGLLIALGFVLTVEDPARFGKSREIGPSLGLCPRQADSGRYEPELRISKRGDALLRRLLVSVAQYILGPFGPDCTLRRKGLALAGRGGKNAKKRAVIATARRLAVLLHRLWASGATYEPNRQAA